VKARSESRWDQIRRDDAAGDSRDREQVMRKGRQDVRSGLTKSHLRESDEPPKQFQSFPSDRRIGMGLSLDKVRDFSRHKNIGTLMVYRDNMTNEQGNLAAAVAGTAPTKPETE